MDDKERRKAEVRARLEEAAAAKKKKGFMTPARKKLLRNLLRKKAAEELKKEQERRAEERRNIIAQRTGAPKDLDSMNEAQVQQAVKEYFTRFANLEGDKYDLEYEVAKKDFQIRELAAKVNDVKGRYQKPALKKVSKTAQQMEKIRMFTAKVNQMDYSTGLKKVKKNIVEDDKKEDKPDWAAGKEKSVPPE